MRRLLLFLFLASSAFAQSHEILRPTLDVSSTTTAIGCAGANNSSLSMSSSRDAAGLSTSSSNFAQGTTSKAIYKVRIFNFWAVPTQVYTSLSLKINSSGVETVVSGDGGIIQVEYSLNGGSSWTFLKSGTWPQVTDTINLSAGQDLTKLQVAVCVMSNAGIDSSGDQERITVWDIWTDGTYGSAPSGNGSSQGIPAIQPIFISEFVEDKEKLWLTRNLRRRALIS